MHSPAHPGGGRLGSIPRPLRINFLTFFITMMANKKLWLISIGAIAVVIWTFIGTSFPRWSPSVDKMTEWQLIDQMRILQTEKDRQVNDLDMEQTMQFLQWDESKFASINKQIEELSGMILKQSNQSIPKYEIYRQKLVELTEKATKVEEEKTPSQLLEESLGF